MGTRQAKVTPFKLLEIKRLSYYENLSEAVETYQEFEYFYSSSSYPLELIKLQHKFPHMPHKIQQIELGNMHQFAERSLHRSQWVIKKIMSFRFHGN